FVWGRLLGAFSGFRFSLQPTLGAVLLALGFVGGWGASSFRVLPSVAGNDRAIDQIALQNVSSIQSINPNPDGKLEIVFDVTRRRVVSGTADDPNIERLLLQAASQLSNAGIRLDSIDLLKGRAADQEIRTALVAAFRTDQNPGVRLKALGALRDYSADEQVKQ